MKQAAKNIKIQMYLGNHRGNILSHTLETKVCAVIKTKKVPIFQKMPLKKYFI